MRVSRETLTAQAIALLSSGSALRSGGGTNSATTAAAKVMRERA